MKLTIEELAEKINEELSSLSSNDKRFSNSLSVRRIRDYMSKGVLDKPFKDGKNIYFTELHYQKLIALREVQSEGISEVSVKKMMSYENEIKNIEEPSLKNKAFETINEIMNFKNATSLNAMASASGFAGSNSMLSNSQHKSVNYLNSLIDSSPLSKTKETKSYISKAISKSWSEIPLLTNNKVFFRMESNTNFSEEEKKEVLHNIKQILGISGEEK